MKLFSLLLIALTLQRTINDLPLKIIHLLPSEELLNDKQAITIVYNRAVIPIGSDFGRNFSNTDSDLPFQLGCNVPGRYRWVTTSIFRFDPDTWPTDLSCPLEVNQNLKTFDGKRLSNDKDITFKTTNLQMSIVNVVSNRTLELTGGWWGVDSQIPEIPPDSELEIHFNTKIQLENVASNLKLKNGRSYSRVFVKDCPNNDQCVLVRFFRTLKPKTRYQLVLLKGTKVNEYAGPIEKEISLPIQGLLEFKFYFLNLDHIIYNRWHLWLIHGLRNNTNIQKFKDVISISPRVEINFRREELGVLIMEGIFQPQTEYTITVRSSSQIKDGYGLNLVGSSVKFKTGKWSEFLQVPENRLLYFDQFPLTWDILMRGNPSQDLRFENVKWGTIEKMMGLYSSYQQTSNGNTLQKSFQRRRKDGLAIYHLNSSSLLENTGLFAQEKVLKYGQTYSQYSMVNKVTILAHIFAIEPKKIIFWITSVNELKDITNARVTLYKNGSPVESKFTDNDGIIRFNDAEGYGYSAVVEHGDNIIFIEDVQSTYSSTNEYTSAFMFSDRKIYNIGDKVYLKGYLRTFDRTTNLESIPKSNIQLSLQYDFLSEMKLDYNSNFGSFEASFIIPSNATYGFNQLSLKLLDNYIGSISFLISDPRVPSALLTLDSESRIIKFEQKTKIIIRLTTYTGLPLQNQDVKLKYRIYKQNICFFGGFSRGIVPDYNCQREKDITQGQIVLRTDSNGFINYDYSLPNVEGIDYENIVDFTATYFSPTRETLEKNLKLFISPSDLRIELKTSSNELIPGIYFQVYGNVQNFDLKRIEKNVTIELYEWNDLIPSNPHQKPQSLEDQEPLNECKILSSKGSSSACEFILPYIGKFILLGSTEDDTGELVYTTLVIGKNETEWRRDPLKKIDEIVFQLDKESYKIGDLARISFSSPFKESYGLIIWDSYNNHEMRKEKFSFGPQTFSILVSEKCKKGCIVSIILYTPNGIGLETSNIRIPSSVLYDKKSAQSFKKVLQIQVQEDNVLDFEMKPKDMILSPGSQSSIRIQLQGNETGEITFWIVDKALLDLLPNDIPNSNYFNYGQLTSGINLDSTTKYFVSERVYRLSKNTIIRRYLKDGYLSQNWDLLNTYNSYDEPDDEFLKKHFSFLTQQRRSYGRIIQLAQRRRGIVQETFSPRSPTLEKGIARDQGEGGAPTSSNEEKIRSFFSVTPLFISSLKFDSGVAEIPFQLPDNIGTFVLNAFTVTSDDKFGYKNISIVSRKNINLIPSIPRIIRIGDSFEAGCTVSITDLSYKGNYEVSINIDDDSDDFLEIIGKEAQRIRLQDTNPKEVTFKFYANKKGTANVYFFVRGSQRDSFKISIPILGLQEPVFVASSFAISQDSDRNEGILIPETVGNAKLNITTGVGRLPSILSLSERLLNENSKEMMEYPYCYPSLYFSKTFPKGIFSKYYKSLISQDLLFKSEQFYALALKSFEKCTDSTLGLQYGSMNQIRTANGELNVMGLYMIQRLSELEVKFPEELQNSWKSGLLRYLDQYTTLSLDFYSYSHLVLTDWKPSQENRTLNYLKKNFKKLSSGGRAALGITLTRLEKDLSIVDQIVESLMNSVRIQGRTAYFTSGNGSPFITNVFSSTLALKLMILRKYQSPVLEKIANYFSSYESSDAGFNILSLTDYDSFKQNTNPNLVVNIRMDNNLLISKLFNDPREIPNVVEKDLPGNNQTIHFEASGTGEASVAIGILFEPAQLYSSPIYRGIFVEKVIRALDPYTGEPTGVPITSSQPGTAISITIQVTTPDDLSTIQIIDPLAGCIEAIDTNLKPTEPKPLFKGFPMNEPSQYKKNEVIFLNHGLTSGSHTFQYKAYIVSSGRFVVPPTKAFVLNQPELMGLSSSFYFQVESQ